jgi:hypothetical protein
MSKRMITMDYDEVVEMQRHRALVQKAQAEHDLYFVSLQQKYKFTASAQIDLQRGVITEPSNDKEVGCDGRNI